MSGLLEGFEEPRMGLGLFGDDEEDFAPTPYFKNAPEPNREEDSGEPEEVVEVGTIEAPLTAEEMEELLERAEREDSEILSEKAHSEPLPIARGNVAEVLGIGQEIDPRYPPEEPTEYPMGLVGEVVEEEYDQAILDELQEIGVEIKGAMETLGGLLKNADASPRDFEVFATLADVRLRVVDKRTSLKKSTIENRLKQITTKANVRRTEANAKMTELKVKAQERIDEKTNGGASRDGTRSMSPRDLIAFSKQVREFRNQLEAGRSGIPDEPDLED